MRVHHSHVAQRCDRLGNATEERRNVVLAFTRRVHLREMERLPFIHATRMPDAPQVKNALGECQHVLAGTGYASGGYP